jgi:seryl-tRNA synthetase
MKKYIRTVLVMVCAALSLNAMAQEEKALKRPDNISVSNFDDFKNNAFDILEQSSKLKQDVTTLDTEIKNYAGVMSTLSAEKLKKDYNALRDMKRTSQTLTEKISELDNQGKDLLSSAKDVSPKTKSMGATSNTNKSVKGLDSAKKNLNAVATLLQTNSKLIVDELKKKGESVEEF